MLTNFFCVILSILLFYILFICNEIEQSLTYRRIDIQSLTRLFVSNEIPFLKSFSFYFTIQMQLMYTVLTFLRICLNTTQIQKLLILAISHWFLGFYLRLTTIHSISLQSTFSHVFFSFTSTGVLNISLYLSHWPLLILYA